jgi:hypothetical protein
MGNKALFYNCDPSQENQDKLSNLAYLCFLALSVPLKKASKSKCWKKTCFLGADNLSNIE